MDSIEILESKPSHVSMKKSAIPVRGEGKYKSRPNRHPINYSRLKRILEQYVGKSWQECFSTLRSGMSRDQRYYLEEYLRFRVMEEGKGNPMKFLHPDYLISKSGTLLKTQDSHPRPEIKEAIIWVFDCGQIFCRNHDEWSRAHIKSGEKFGGNEVRFKLRMGNYVPVNEWVWHLDFFGFSPARDINKGQYSGPFSSFSMYSEEDKARYVTEPYPHFFGKYVKMLSMVDKHTASWLDRETKGKHVIDIGVATRSRVGDFSTIDIKK